MYKIEGLCYLFLMSLIKLVCFLKNILYINLQDRFLTEMHTIQEDLWLLNIAEILQNLTKEYSFYHKD